MIIIPEIHAQDRDRTELFYEYAQARARGEMAAIPTMYNKEQRRLYVRQTMREDHQFRIKNRPEGAQAKFNKLADAPFDFFRGTALLYYRDYAGSDSHLPQVFTIGDVHPENFGAMPNEDGAPFFGVNDFDEAYVAPFSYDVKRGGVGFFIIARSNGLSKKKSRKVVRAFVKGYLKALKSYAHDDREKWHEFRIDNSPDMIQELLTSARTRREEFLEELIDLKKERFISSDEIVPHSKYVSEFQDVVDRYRDENEIGDRAKEDDFFQVIDVAVKKDSGTASLGLDRYFVLIQGRTGATNENIILEMKQARRSALYGLTPNDEMESGEVTDIVTAQNIHLVGGDPYYGHVTYEDKPFLVRERSPFKDDIDVDDLDKGELKRYAHVCGRALAQTHARSDEDTGVMEGDAEKRILSSIIPEVFSDDVIRFAQTGAKRVKKDYKLFKKDLKLGAFEFLHKG